MGCEADILHLMATIKNIYSAQEKNAGVYFAGKPMYQQLTKEILWSEFEVSNLTWKALCEYDC